MQGIALALLLTMVVLAATSFTILERMRSVYKRQCMATKQVDA
jgi:hypothetical protein